VWRVSKRALLALAVLALAWWGVRALVHALASPETKIRWAVEDMVEGFNETHLQTVLDGIARGFVDRTSALTRDDLRSTLAWMFLNETDDQGGFLWSATFDPESLAVLLAEDEQSAQASCSVQFFRRRGAAEPELVWDARVAGTLASGDDGWQWTVLTSANHAQRRRR
jgi:hypothetical protein